MPFIYRKNHLVKIEIGEKQNSFIIKVKNPGVNQLLDIYADYFSTSEEEETSRLPVEVMRSLKKMLVENTVDWEGITDESGQKLPFSQGSLDEILNADMTLFQCAINGAMETFFTREKESEKN